MTTPFDEPVDQEQRQRIESALEQTFFVEAGAGTGKTTSMVGRIANLITTGKATIDSLAAITFTEAASAELRDRVRHKLEQIAGDEAREEDVRKRCLSAILGLDSASIQTLHSFAGSLLRERPLDAGLPPGFEITDEVGADIEFEERWQHWLDLALESDDVAPLLLEALNLGLKLDALREVAVSFHKNYDLLPQDFKNEPRPSKEAVNAVVGATDQIRSLLECNLTPDYLHDHASRVFRLGDRLAAMESDPDGALCLLDQFGKIACGKGNKSNWTEVPDTKSNACTVLKDLLKGLEEAKSLEVESVRRVVLMPLLESVRHMVVSYVDDRRKAGKAEFHDLLVWARDLLRDSPEARVHFQRRFSHILVDEFQDTDPIQAEIAFYLVAPPRAGAGENWMKITPVPGKLFVVGDPKQSIYRFRRADISAVEKVRSLMGGETITLVQNFRSQEPILVWVNRVFEPWMGAGLPGIQAAYTGLRHRWTAAAANPPLGVHWIGGQVDGRAPLVRRAEAQGIAALLLDMKCSKWKVRAGEDGALRDAEYRDMCLLMPTRTGLPQLERALEQKDVPYRIESQSLVLATHDVREMLSCLRAIDSPVDQVALVAALRSSAFACSDADLLKFVDAEGRFDYTSPGKANGPVREAMGILLDYHRRRLWTPVEELIESFIRDRRMSEVSFGRARPRERLRRLRLVVEQARVFRQTAGGSLRAFLDWIERLADENVRLVESPVAETDEDAVRIMTVHAAKGLEFPVVVLTGLGNSRAYRNRPAIFRCGHQGVEVSIGESGRAFCTTGFADAKAEEKRAEEAEAVRLVYVAATRAKDHLVISLYRTEKRSENSHAAAIEGFAGRESGLWDEVVAGLASAPAPLGAMPGGNEETDSITKRQAWIEGRRKVLARASRPASVGVTSLAKVNKEEAERGELPYRRGRGGTNLGRAVHSVLQSIDLATGAHLEEASRAQASAEGMPDRWGEVAELASNALNAVVVKRAVASTRYYREVFVGLPLGGRLLEGFIDLMFEEPDGIVIVDYKTDAIEGPDTADAAQRYRMQAGAYVLAVDKITRKRVKEVVLVFLKPQREETLSDVEELAKMAAVMATTEQERLS